ncbi:hypothetical protein EMCRGX_G022115 [Ephydatia muelleri]
MQMAFCEQGDGTSVWLHICDMAAGLAGHINTFFNNADITCTCDKLVKDTLATTGGGAKLVCGAGLVYDLALLCPHNTSGGGSQQHQSSISKAVHKSFEKE